VALVGSSGSGKTTVAQLLARFYSPQQGAIHYGPHDIAALELRSWREQLAWVGQQVVLFDDSVAANMAYGRPDLPREKIVEAARAAHAWEFIERLPQQLDAPCGHNGVNLSGGQRQRIAIARAFLKDAPVLILDEATSALDNESERQVQEALGTLAATAPPWSSPTACPPSSRPTGSSRWTRAGWWSRAATPTCWPAGPVRAPAPVAGPGGDSPD
jgi:subfamily B ATP-binding cassette protein MsbA